MTSPKQTYESNALIQRLPKHLKQFIKPQHYEQYTPIDQAVWRYVMRRNVHYLPQVAHESYLEGLKKTAVEIDSIPSMYGMNRILKEIGWAAVAVDGFIPPNAFMEFQAYKVLVIASDIRQLEHIEYTPAPDILHEAAGHAPIIANPDYAEYLRRLGAIGAKAILSKHDIEVYEAVRSLSFLKEAKNSSAEALKKAADKVEKLQNKKVALSEMAQVQNLQWWTVEYGLVGEMDAPKIYGAGLLSSIGESKSCTEDHVTKIPYSADASQQSFDITKPQPQLYVANDFSKLMEVLEQFANTLSVRKGGTSGLHKLIDSACVGTIEINTGLQISGVFSEMICNEDNQVVYYMTKGPTALSYREKELIGHGVTYHKQGFSSPLGKLKNINLAIEDMGPYDLKAYNFYDNKWLSFEFESGVKVEGLNVTGIRNLQGKLMLIQLTSCTVTYQDRVLFKPEYGTYDMAIGCDIVSAFAGSADADSFPNLYEASTLSHHRELPIHLDIELENLYQKIRSCRAEQEIDTNELAMLWKTIQNKYPQEWLLMLELIEISDNALLNKSIESELNNIANNQTHLKALIKDGLELL